MPQEDYRNKTAIISFSKALLGVSFSTIAALGGLSGVVWVALATTAPGAILNAVGSLEPLLQRVKGTKEDAIIIAMPDWWSRRNDNSWQEVCTAIEGKLPNIMERTIEQLQQETHVPHTGTILRIFTREIERFIPTWETNMNERGLIATVVAGPFLSTIAMNFKAQIETLQRDALVQKVEELADAVAALAVTAQTPQPLAVNNTDEGSLPSQPSSGDVLRVKMQKEEYDVYICYQKIDLQAVKDIDRMLKDAGILPWFDMYERVPGLTTLGQQDQRIKKMKVGAVFIGKESPGKEQTLQIEALIHEFIKREFVRIIPVYLPEAPSNLELSAFLENFAGVDFRESEPDPFAYLLWGITNKRPATL